MLHNAANLSNTNIRTFFSSNPFSGYSVDRKVAKVMPYSGPHEDEEIALDEEEQDPLATNEPNQVFWIVFTWS